MSHNRLRKEKDCLNCGALVEGRYCPACGQENVEPKQTLWHLLTHFFSDVTHFDGKFFTTVKPLIFRPGFLSSEYILGRRTKYLDPVRMYLFISAIFALAFISFNQDDMVVKEIPGYNAKVDSMRHVSDSMRRAGQPVKFEIMTDTLANGDEVVAFAIPDTWKWTAAQYDSAQRSLPPAKRSGWLGRYYAKKGRAAARAYDAYPYHAEARLLTNFFHSISKIFFFSLPIFASILYLLYIRRRKQYFYVSHAIFAIHYYCVILIFWGIFYMLPGSLIPEHTWSSIASWIDCFIIFSLVVYLFIALRRFYKQSFGKTLLKFLILGILHSIVLLLIVSFLFFDSALELGHA